MPKKKQELTDEEIKAQSGAALPDREEMSLINPHFLGPPVAAPGDPPPPPVYYDPPPSGPIGPGDPPPPTT